jgi:phosphoribosylformylglycinamidine (FGAM) synthase-like enzyme
LAEACFAHGTGVDVQLFGYPMFPTATRLFGEEATRVLVTCDPDEASRIEQIFSGGQPGVWRLGTVTDGRFSIRVQEYEEAPTDTLKYRKAENVTAIETSTAELKQTWSGTLQESLAGDVVTA